MKVFKFVRLKHQLSSPPPEVWASQLDLRASPGPWSLLESALTALLAMVVNSRKLQLLGRQLDKPRVAADVQALDDNRQQRRCRMRSDGFGK